MSYGHAIGTPIAYIRGLQLNKGVAHEYGRNLDRDFVFWDLRADQNAMAH